MPRVDEERTPRDEPPTIFDEMQRRMYRMAILLLQALREMSRLYHTMLLDAVDALILGLAVRLQVETRKALQVSCGSRTLLFVTFAMLLAACLCTKQSFHARALRLVCFWKHTRGSLSSCLP